MLPISLTPSSDILSRFGSPWYSEGTRDPLFRSTAPRLLPFSTRERRTPATDVVETEGEILLRMEIPGVAMEEVDVTLEGSIVTVAGEKRPFGEEESTRTRLSERWFGEFRRSFTVPRKVDPEKVEAHYDRGILTLRLPKVPGARPRRIEVESGGGLKRILSGRKKAS